MTRKDFQGADINTRTGTTLEERRRIRRKYKAEKVLAMREGHSRAVTPEFRENYNGVDFFKAIAARYPHDEQWEERKEAEREHRTRCMNPDCSCHVD